jgi:16S rRNA pseudouridine516 synthase
MPHKDSTLASMLHDQGHGTRRECADLVRHGLVEVAHGALGAASGLAWRIALEPAEEIDRVGLHLKVRGEALPYLDPVHIVLHKPGGYECSHSSSHHPSVFSLVPAPWVRRGLQAVGRLDADTTGLLLLSDNGAFNHFFTSPRRHVPKTYRVEVKHPIASDQVERLTSGVVLRDEKEPTRPAVVKLLGDRTCEMTLEVGRYHQVKRMFAAVGNRVEGIHRVAIGQLRLDEGLAAGTWRALSAADLDLLGYREP